MGRHQSFASGSEIPKSMRAARGADVSWKEEARCRSNHRPEGLPHFAWTVDPKDKGALLLGREAKAWIEMALLICQACPAQYGCARFALKVGEEWGTWAMHTNDLKQLHRHPRKDLIIDAAEDAGIPVQVAVRRALG
ncbi:MAG: Transcription factor WhiB [Thermomicrobiales bacterium]|jgi:hypothetical protein|nr:Transcription factor WhiB [Thermomicrobiales bacterium]